MGTTDGANPFEQPAAPAASVLKREIGNHGINGKLCTLKKWVPPKREPGLPLGCLARSVVVSWTVDEAASSDWSGSGG
jgi:hypothetical protein